MSLIKYIFCTFVVCQIIGTHTLPLEENNTGDGPPPKPPEVAITESKQRLTCCQRDSKRIIAGYDTSRRPIYLDVGHCRKTCQQIEDTWYENGLERANEQRHSCPINSTCKPTRTRIERFTLHDGQKDYEIIEDCHCVNKHRRCKRKEFKKLYFANTPYQVEVDVGMCIGRCRHEKTCQPLRNRTISVPGPNGDELVSVIEECRCSGKCYRMQHKQVYTETYLNETTWQLNTRMKEIDVGVCNGGCNTGGKFRCLRWSDAKPRMCIMTLRNKQKRCVPTGFETHVFTTTNYEERTVLSIKECKCARKRNN